MDKSENRERTKRFFQMSEEKLRIYLAHGEEASTRRMKYEDHVEMVMFLSVVTCPRYKENFVCLCLMVKLAWPFVHQVAAQRTSTYQPAPGTMETNPVKLPSSHMLTES